MEFSINSIKLERQTAEGKLLEPDQKKGIKYAFLAAISLLALTILATFLITALALAISNFVTGVGIFTGICLLGSAVVDALPFAYITAIAIQCILNAKHHCRKTTPMPPVQVTQQPVTINKPAAKTT